METGAGKNLTVKKRQVKNQLVPYFGGQRADTLTEFTINTYKKKRAGQKAAAGTINRELATLKHLLRDAVKAKDLKAVPCGIAMLAEPAGRIVVLSEAEADAMVKAAIGDQDPDLWLFVAFGLNTAMRHSEILAARFDEVDWDRGRLHIPKAKAGAREQPLTLALVAILRKEREQRGGHAGHIFPSRNNKPNAKPHRTRISKGFERAVKRAKLDPSQVTPHVMRHTAITRLVQAGVDLPTIQRISGHKTMTMVLRYAHVSGAHIDAAMLAVERTIPELPQPAENSAGTQPTHELHKPRASPRRGRP